MSASPTSWFVTGLKPEWSRRFVRVDILCAYARLSRREMLDEAAKGPPAVPKSSLFLSRARAAFEAWWSYLYPGQRVKGDKRE
jgi:hypothetical protein